MKGFVTFEDKKYPFSFSGERLALYPDEFSSQSLQEFFAPFERGNTIKDIEEKSSLYFMELINEWGEEKIIKDINCHELINN